ncbi:hypothetical protein [Curtobacterium sp. Leaf261]|uniref:hypothetical protein n=1 Tax=Curtobacterium sp. Leaf261 TaxID=1736311 RepID=UPI0006FFFE10|nr:hypothetical protein [Curtobacterium sp. Leaf261]KQO63638.1 hypothetical protein ASF23_05255 [Curtobacterium sp. Leaf261]
MNDDERFGTAEGQHDAPAGLPDAAEGQHDAAASLRDERPHHDDGWGSVPSVSETGGTRVDGFSPDDSHAPRAEPISAGPDTATAPAPMPPAAMPPAPTFAAAPAPAYGQNGQYPAAAPGPWSYQPKPRRRLGRKALVGIIGGAVALLLVIVLGSVGYATGSSQNAPERQVDAFLDALEHGHATAALKIAHVPTSGQPLLTDAVYAKATDTITAHRIVSTRTSDGTADVAVVLTQGGSPIPTTFHLVDKGSTGVFFTKWQLDVVALGSVKVHVEGPSGAKVTVAGKSVDPTSDDSTILSALPGTYDTAIADTKWYTGNAQAATVWGFASGDGTADITTTLTDAGKQAATDAVNGWVDGCIASTDIQPANCSFYAYGESPDNTYSDQKWTLDTRPVVEVGDWTSRGWTMRTTTPGAATFTSSFTGPSGLGTGTAGPITFYADGYITAFTEAGATYAPAITNAAGGGAAS